MIKKTLYSITLISLFILVSGCDVFEAPPKYGCFLGWENVLAMVDPADLNVYESLLPVHLRMPEKPKLIVGAVNYSNVRIPLRPYYEIFIAMKAKEPWNQREGYFILTMPVTGYVAEFGGIMLGFPKYIADDITLESTAEHDLVGELVHDGRSMIKMEFDGIGHELSEVFSYSEQQIKDALGDKYHLYNHSLVPSDYDLFDMLIVLSKPTYYVYPPEEATPPGTMTKLKMAKFNYDPHKIYTREVGIVQITVDPADPWGGLFSGKTEALAFRTNWKGKADLIPVLK